MSASSFDVRWVAGERLAPPIPPAHKASRPAQAPLGDRHPHESEARQAWLASLLRVRPELQSVCSFGAQWASPHAPEERGWAPFHIVTSGKCRLLVGTEAVTLDAGDVAILPHGSPHTLQAAVSTGEAAPVRTTCRTSDAILLKGNTDHPAEVGLICGRLRFEQVHDALVLATLPPLIVFVGSPERDATDLRSLVEMMRAELERDRLGSALVAGALAQAMLTYILRSQLDRAPEQRGLPALLRSRQAARAVAAMLESPARAWTLDEVAERAGASRATVVRLFNRSAGLSPLAFLTELRLTLARSRLRASQTPIAVIADEVGYSSETAFSRAYRRRFACAPARDRHHAG